MSGNPKFQFWPLLDKEINRGIGRAGVVFTALFCLFACGVGYYFIRPWSILSEEDLRQLGYLGLVAIPLAAWLLGGQLGIQLFMSFQVFHWVSKNEIHISGGTWAWIGLGVAMLVGGVFGGVLTEPSEYGFLVCVAGAVIFLRTTCSIWSYTIFLGTTSFPR
jgi:hypothetical protein